MSAGGRTRGAGLSRGAFVEDKVEFYCTALLQLLQRGRTAEAFALMERARSRVMLDLIKT